LNFEAIASSPLNNFTHFYDFIGEPLDSVFGANCVSKVSNVISVAALDNVSGAIICERNGTHRAAVLDLDGQFAFYDPSLLMMRPLVLDYADLIDGISQSCFDPCDFRACFEGSVRACGVANDFLVDWQVWTPLGAKTFSMFFDINDVSSDVNFPWSDQIFNKLPLWFYFRYVSLKTGYLYNLQYFSKTKKIVFTPTFTPEIVYSDTPEALSLISDFEFSTGINFDLMTRTFNSIEAVFYQAKSKWSR